MKMSKKPGPRPSKVHADGTPKNKPKRYSAGAASDPQPVKLPEGVRGRLFEQTGLTDKNKFGM
jgi:hypothetical protein